MEVGKKSKAASVSSITTLARSAVTQVLGGSLRSVVKRSKKGESVSRQPFFSLPLDIHQSRITSLMEAITHFVSKEELDTGPEKVTHKAVSIEKLPTVLVLQLKRFVFRGNQAEKVGKHIDFPLDLQLDKRHLAATAQGSKERVDGEQGGKYSLEAVISHHGKQLERGHYTCDVAVPSSLPGAPEGAKEWMRCDDDKIWRVTETDMLAQPAYVLVYRK